MARLYKPPAFSGASEFDSLAGRQLDRALETIVAANNTVSIAEANASIAAAGFVPSSGGVFEVDYAPISGTVLPGYLVSHLANGSVAAASAADPNRQAHAIVIRLVLMSGTTMAEWITAGTGNGLPPVVDGLGRRLYLSVVPGRTTTDIGETGKLYHQEVGTLKRAVGAGLRRQDILIIPPSNLPL